MEYLDIVTVKEWDLNGQKKTKWLKVGTLKKNDDGKMFVEINVFPNTKFFVFEQKKKDEAQEQFGE